MCGGMTTLIAHNIIAVTEPYLHNFCFVSGKPMPRALKLFAFL